MSLPPRLAPETSPAIPRGPRPDTLQALHRAASSSKTPFNTLVSIAMAESHFDVNAKSRKSSATGPFQITERTWLSLVKRYGAEAGRADLASLVKEDAQGRATVDAEHKAAVLDARKDLDLSAKLAAKLCDESRTALSRKLGREPSEAEVRMAYFLGVPGATRLLAAATDTPDASVKALLPRAYASNRTVLSAAGSPFTAGEAADALHARYTREIASSPAKPAPSYVDVAALASEPGPDPVGSLVIDVAKLPDPPADIQVAEATAEAPTEAPAAQQLADASAPKALDCRPDPAGIVCKL